eukprot:2357864-Rhodomonas_salina.1
MGRCGTPNCTTSGTEARLSSHAGRVSSRTASASAAIWQGTQRLSCTSSGRTAGGLKRRWLCARALRNRRGLTNACESLKLAAE